MDARRNPDSKAVLAMAVLCLIWSMQQIGLKATAEDASPILQMAARSGIAAVLVAILMRMRGEPILSSRLPWCAGLAAGMLFSMEYLLLGAGLQHTSAAHGVVFLYTAPLFAALGLHLRLPSERLAPLQWLGILLAFAGIAINFFLKAEQDTVVTSSTLLGDILCLGAGMAWGATTVLVRCSRLAHAPATQTALYQLAVSFLLLLLASLALGQWWFKPTVMVISNLVFQSVVVSFISLVAWFALLRRYLASRLGAFSFMTPLSGVVLGIWLLDEHIQPGFVIGSALVIAGIVLVSAYHWLLKCLLPNRKREIA